ncbi:hypothetical protein JHK85_001847 [Glycine max]|nr:hypothetical protein JHK85_001847 [Glycine max]
MRPMQDDRREMSRGNALVTMYSRWGMLDEARRVFDEMPERDLVLWNAMISGYAQMGECYRLEAVLLFVNIVRQWALLDMYGKRGDIIESQRVFNKTLERTQFAWTTIIFSYAHHGDFESVMSLHTEMERLHENMEMAEKVVGRLIEMDPASSSPYVLMANLYAEKWNWEIEMDPASSCPYVLMANLYAEKGKWEIKMAKKVVGRLIEMDPASSGPYVLMANLYAEKRKWEKVADVQRGMRRRGE